MKQKQESAFEKINNAIRNSVSIKLLSIGFLIAILLIPQSMIKSLIHDRQFNRYRAVTEIYNSWAAPLELNGPVLTVPILDVFETDGKVFKKKNYVHFLPERLKIEGKVEPETRKRGIYEVIVYTTRLSLSGHFGSVDLSDYTENPNDIFWEEATLSMGIPDMRGIQSSIDFELGPQKYRMEPGIPSHLQLDLGQQIKEHDYDQARSFKDQTGVNAKVNIDSNANKTDFQVSLDIRGTKTLRFNPVGKSTEVHLESSWPHPSFNGQFLPDSHEITDEGFTASWSVFDLNRNYPQRWMGKSHKIASAEFGVDLYQPVDNYQQNERSAKYAVLILFLTFISFFFIEILNKKRIHPVQYILVGLALTVFYTLLLSLSEQVGFTMAYWISAIIIIGMLSIYSLSILRSKRLAGFMLLFFLIIYGFIFIILRMEDLSLLVGSFGLLLVIGLCMYFSRKVDWYNIKPKEKAITTT